MNSLTANNFELRIESLSYHGGRGVGRHEREVIFVPGTAPGDLVQVEIIEKQKNYSVGRMLRLLEPGPSRVDAPCVVYGQCGGCVWQHITYQEQLTQKQKILEDSFRRLAKKVGPIPFLPFIPSSLEYRYRNRIQVHRQGTQVGFFRQGSRTLVPTADCLIAEVEVAQKIPAVLQEASVGEQEKFEIARTEDGSVGIYQSHRNPEAIFFSQVHAIQNRNLIQTVLQSIATAPTEILDLFCGHGNFTFPLQQKFPMTSIVGVELSKVSVHRATERARAGVFQHLQFVAEDVAAYLVHRKSMAEDSVVLLDPPRTGAGKDVIRHLLRLKPRTILYVSCQPMTLTRDLELLAADSEYELSSVQGFDMFPQTAHVEAFCVMHRRNSG